MESEIVIAIVCLVVLASITAVFSVGSFQMLVKMSSEKKIKKE